MKIDLNKSIGKPKFPTKVKLNLAQEERSVKNPKAQIGIFVIFLLLLGVFVKFMVVDKLSEAASAQRAYQNMQNQIQLLKEQNNSNKEVREKYSHYGYGYLSDEEKIEQDRMEILDLIGSVAISRADIQKVEISANVATITIDKIQLKTVSAIVEDLEADERVSFVTVSTAGTDSGNKADVSATIVINFAEKDGERQ